MSSTPETFEQIVAPLQEEFEGMGKLIDPKYRQGWAILFLSRGFSPDQVAEMMGMNGGYDEV